MRVSRRAFLASVSALALSAAMAHAASHGTAAGSLVTIVEVTMAAPDVIRVEIHDPPVLHGGIFPITPQNYSYSWASFTNPLTGQSQKGQVIGPGGGTYVRFCDVAPTVYYNRAAGDVAGSWTIVGGPAVTAVYRKSRPYDSCRATGAGSPTNSAVFRHFVYLQLASNLSQATYKIVPPLGTNLPAISFTFNDKTTRCCSILATQTGHRLADIAKYAYLAQWIPGYGTHGAVDFMGHYGLTDFNIINSSGTVVYNGAGKLAARTAPTTIESDFISTSAFLGTITGGASYTNGAYNGVALTGGSGSGLTANITVSGNAVTAVTVISYGKLYQVGDTLSAAAASIGGTGSGFSVPVTGLAGSGNKMIVYPDLSVPSKTITAITNANPGQVTCANHGFTNGQTVFLHCIGGMTQLTGSVLGVFVTVGNATTNTFTIGIDTSGFSAYTPGTYLPGFDSQVFATWVGNRSATYVTGMDYGSANWTPSGAGTYYVQVPGLGVSDPFVISEDTWYKYAAVSSHGYYHQCNGIALDGRFGWSRPIALRDGVGNCEVFQSALPIVFTPEAQSTLSNAVQISDYQGAYPPYLTANRATGIYGAYRDAGDWDSVLLAHTFAIYNLLDLCIEKLPSAARTTNFNFPKSSQTLDPTLYAGTDSFPDAWHQAAWYVDFYRRLQNPDGSVYSGMLFGVWGGVGGNGFEPSYLNEGDGSNVSGGYGPTVVMAPDHLSNYFAAAIFAKFAISCYILGASSLGATYATAALNAWAWAEPLFAGTGGSGTLANQKTYYNGTLNLQANTAVSNLSNNIPPNIEVVGTITGTSFVCTSASNPVQSGSPAIGVGSVLSGPGVTSGTVVTAGGPGGAGTYTVSPSQNSSPIGAGISDATFASAMSSIDSHCQGAGGARCFAAGCIFHLSDYGTVPSASTYGAIVDGFFGSALSDGMWEYIFSANATPSHVTYYLNHTQDNTNFINDQSGWSYLNSIDPGENWGPGDLSALVQSMIAAALLNGSSWSAGNTSGMPVTGLQSAAAQAYLATIQTGLQWVAGANQMGISCTTGLGKRYTQRALHQDAISMGLSTPIGYTTYTWVRSPRLYQFNVSIDTSPANFTVDAPEFSTNLVYSPTYLAVPPAEFFFENEFAVQSTEFTTEQSMLPMQYCAMWCSGWDGNSQSGSA